MSKVDALVQLIAQKLRGAYKRHGFEVDSRSFALEMRSLYGDEAQAMLAFFEGQSDLPLGTVLKLCSAIGISPSQILDDGEREHVQIYDYLGGNPAHVFLPFGLFWDRSVLDDSLYYFVVQGDCCDGIGANDFGARQGSCRLIHAANGCLSV